MIPNDKIPFLVFILVYLEDISQATKLRSFEQNSTSIYYNLVPGGNVTLKFDFEFEDENSSLPIPAVIFQGGITLVEFDTSSAVIDDIQQTISFVLLPANLNELGYGDHNCTFYLSTNSSDTKSVNVVVSYEEPITNLQITCNTVQKVDTPAHISLTLESGSNIQLQWYINGQTTTASSSSGNGTREFQNNLTLNTTGQVNISVNASNSVSSVMASATVYNYYRINGFHVTTSPSALSSDSVVTLKMTPEAQLPQGSLSIHVLYIDGNSTVLNISSTEPSLQSGRNFTHRYSSIGSHTVSVMVMSPIENKTYNIISNVYDSISTVQVQCSSYQKVGHPIEFNVSIPTGSKINLKWYINTSLTFNTSYETHGEYTESRMVSALGLVFVYFTASNPVSEAHHNLTFTNLHPINGFSLIGDEVVRNENATVTLKLDSASHLPQGNLSVGINFGDSTQIMNLISSSNESLKTTGLLFTHSYSNEGNYSIHVQLISPVDVKNYSTIVQVMEPITGIQIHSDRMQTFGSPVNISVRLENGYNVIIKWLTNGEIVNTTFHSEKGIRTCEVNLNPSVTGEVNLTAIAYNAVSEALNSTIIYLYYAINGFSLFAHPSTIYKDASIVLLREESANLPQGNFSIVLQYGDGNFTSLRLDANDSACRSPGYVFSNHYSLEGEYTVELNITSPVDEQILISKVQIVEPIQNISFSTDKYHRVGEDLVIEAQLSKGFNVTTTWYIGSERQLVFVHNGTGDRFFNVNFTETLVEKGRIDIVVAASNLVSQVNFSFTTYFYYGINGIFLTPSVASPLMNATLYIKTNTTALVPQGVLDVNIDFSDGRYENTTLEFLNTTLIDPNWPISHLYSRKGNYSVTAKLTSPLGEETITSLVEVIEPISGIQFDCPLYIEVGKEIRIHATIFGGEKVITNWKFGNGSQLERAHFENGTRNFTVLHNVSGSGEINISVVAFNPISSTFNSTLVSYFYGINGFQIRGPATLSMYNITYINCWLTANASNPMGDINISIMFGDGNITAVDIDSDNDSLQNPGFVFPHEYQTFGDYIVTAQVTSHINSVNYSTLIEILEPVEGIQIECSLYNIVGKKVHANATITFGTKLEIFWTFGENNTAIQKKNGSGIRSYSFEQDVTSTGQVNVTVEARNAVSSAKNETSIFYYFLVEGFYIQNNITVQTKESALISLKIAANASQPQGNISVTLDFGNGRSTCFNIYSDDPLLVSEGFNVTNTYDVQGVYQIQANLTSYVGTSYVYSEIKIWDKINVTLKSKTIAKVGEEIVFEFTNVPNSNFQYRIFYGDSENKTNNETDLYRSYDFKKWTKSYNSNNTFTVKFEVWNPIYNKSGYYDILIEHPLINSSVALSPDFDSIPIPDGKIEFMLNVTKNSTLPTNVECKFYFENREEKIFANKTTLLIAHEFNTSGTKTVSVHCWNNVSSVNKSSIIYVKEYTLEDIKVTYQSPVNMNMTLKTRTPTPENRNFFEAVSIPVDVKFHFDFLGCSRLPLNMEMSWNFGDGSSTEIENSTNLYHSHSFRTRDIFTIDLNITDKNTNNFTSRTMSLQTGILVFNVSPRKGDLRDTDFNMSAKGLLGMESNYTFNANSSDITEINYTSFYDNVTEFTKAERLVKYHKFGHYIPQLIGSNGTVIESVYLSYPVIADLNITHEHLTLDVPDSVPLPPGSVEYKLKLAPGENDPRMYVYCTISTGDGVDRNLKSIEYNITSTDPLRYKYSYIALGKPNLTFACNNTISEGTWNKTVLVYNPAFEIKGIFGREYSLQKSPLAVWTSEQFYISNRMAVLSNSSKKPEFQWDLYAIPEPVKNGTRNISKSQSGTFSISKGTLEPGLYCLNLTVKLPNTSIFEYVYIQLTKPKPFAYITGGSKITSRPTRFFVIDAIEKSHIANGNYGDTKGLNFSWTCNQCSGEYYASDAVFNLSLNQTVGTTISVTVNVSEDSAWDEFTQNISIVSRSSPEIAINCSFNCGKKIAISTKTTFTAWCKENATLDYKWSLWMRPDNYSGYDLVTGFEENTTTGVDLQTLAILGNFLLPGREYRVVLNASYRENEGWSDAFYQFSTNYPPYGGGCEFHVTKGSKEFPLLSVTCENWADEGFQNDQKYERDLRARLPIIYQYETRTMRKQTHGVEDVLNIIYRGSERSIDREYIQTGDISFNYTVVIMVKVFDFFGDYTETKSQEFMVNPPETTQPLDENDNDTVKLMFGKKFFLKEFDGRKRSGNEMSAIRLIGTTASFFKNFSNVDNTTTELEIMTGAVHPDKLYIHSTTSPVVQEYQNIMKKMLDLLRVDLDVHCNSSKYRYSIADYHILFSSIDSITRIQYYITFDILETTTQLMYRIVACLEEVTNIDPFPVGFFKTINETAVVIHRITNRLLDVLLPKNLQDFQISKADIKEKLVRDAERQALQEALLRGVNVSTLIDYTNLDNKANMLYAVREHFGEIQEKQVELAETCFPIMQLILERTQNVLLRTMVLGERHELDSTVVSVITEKITADSIKNRTDEYFIGIQPVNGTSEKHTDVIVSMKVHYFKKNPLIYGENATTVTSGVSIFDIGNDIKLDVKLANYGQFKFQKYLPLINYEYSEKMIFFTFDVVNDNDAIIIFMNPDGFDINNPVNFTLYTFYFSSDTFPTSTSFEFKKTIKMIDWDDIGFKIFIEQGKFRKGTCYLGIKPETVPDYSEYVPSQMRRKREVSQNATTTSPIGYAFIPVEANFSLAIFTTGCRSWNNNTQMVWSSEGCVVLEMSSVNDTVCRCSGNTFSTTFYVPPNMINFLTVFGKFDATNACVYGSLTGMLVIYIIALILLRREDKKDLKRWEVNFLVDHDGDDKYFYLLTVQTGMRRGAGTKSNISFVLVGNEEESGIRNLSDGIKKEFGVASINRFFMGTKEPLGELTYLRIWHDNSGKGAKKSWYLNRVVVDDLQEKDRYVFLCEKWLSLDEDDGMVERILPLSTKENVNSFRTLMNKHTQMNITDQHLWVSLFLRPNISRFSRVQRLTTLTVLLLLVMISNAMFFKSSTEDSSSMQFEIGFIRFSLSTLYISFIGVVITIPPILFVIFAFRKSKVRKSKQRGSSSNNQETKSKPDKYDTSKTNYYLQVLNEDIMFEDSNLILPFWCVHISWVILVLAAATCSFFLLLYSMEWGKEKSEEWLASFFLSFLVSFLFVDPLKVVFLSLLFATIFKSTKDEKPPSIDLDKLREASRHFSGDSRQNFLAFMNNILIKHKPPTEEELQLLWKKNQEEKTAQKAIYNLFLYVLYMIVLFGASYLQRDLRSFHYKSNLENYLLANSTSQLGFSGITNTKEFITWINKTLIPTFYPENNYRGEPLSVVNEKWFGDNSSIRVGPARLRQLRSKRGNCADRRISWNKACVDKYSELDEDTSPYCFGWHTYNHTACGGILYESKHFTANAWKYNKAKDIWGFSILGKYNSYSGGGYILEFTKNRQQAISMLNELIKYYWIDRATRAIFVEFTVHNPNSNLFAYVIFLCEYPETGGTLIWTDIQSFRPVLSWDEIGTYAILCYIVLIAYLFSYLIRIVYKTTTKGFLTFFKVPWNIVDFFITILGLSSCGVYIVRYLDAKKAMQMYSDDILTGTNKFINFGHIVVWDNLFNAFFAVMVFFSILKVLRILGYNRRFTEIISVVTNAGPEIAGFIAVFFVMFSAYVFFGYFLFGVHLEGYKSVFETCSTLANTFIGKNKLDTLMAAAPKTAQFYYFTYMISVMMTLMTMFAAMLNKSISEVRAETAEYLDTIGILDICWKSAKSFLGMFFNYQQKKNSPENLEYNENMQRAETLQNGNSDVTNVMALIRQTFNDFDTFPNKKRENVFSQLTTNFQDETFNINSDLFVSPTKVKSKTPTQGKEVKKEIKMSKIHLYL